MGEGIGECLSLTDSNGRGQILSPNGAAAGCQNQGGPLVLGRGFAVLPLLQFGTYGGVGSVLLALGLQAPQPLHSQPALLSCLSWLLQPALLQLDVIWHTF